MNITELQDSLQNLINTKISLAEIGNILGVSRASISQRAKAGRDMKREEIRLIGEHYNVDLMPNHPIVKSDANNVALDYFPDILVSCGNGIFSLNETKEKITVPKELIKGYSPSQKYFIVTAFSDSMQPEIKEKDMLIVRMTEMENIMDNHIYMFCHDGRFYCKYLSYNLGQVIVRSLNPEYPTRYIEKEDLQNFELIGEIVGLMRDLR